jgi:hypothetical protein
VKDGEEDMSVSKKKSQPKPKRNKHLFIRTLEQFLAALTEIYSMDALAPSITFSMLPAKEGAELWYASVSRYDCTDLNSSKRTVVLNVKGPTLEQCLYALAQSWREGSKNTIQFMSEQLNVKPLRNPANRIRLTTTKKKKR